MKGVCRGFAGGMHRVCSVFDLFYQFLRISWIYLLNVLSVPIFVGCIVDDFDGSFG